MASNSNSNSNHGFVSQLRFSLTIDSASRVDPISHSRLLVRRWSRTPLSKDALSPIIKHITRSREKRKQGLLYFFGIVSILQSLNGNLVEISFYFRGGTRPCNRRGASPERNKTPKSRGG